MQHRVGILLLLAACLVMAGCAGMTWQRALVDTAVVTAAVLLPEPEPDPWWENDHRDTTVVVMDFDGPHRQPCHRPNHRRGDGPPHQ